jgi:hypothetical protein
MKKIYFSFLMLALSLILQSQIVVDQNDMPQPGDTIRLSSTVEFGTLNYQETGNNFTWDFSSLLPVNQRVDTFVEFDETPWIYQLVFWGSSNLAKEMVGFDQYPGFQITDAYEYYKNSSSDYKLVGNAATLNGIPFPNKYDSPDIIFRFPVNPGDVDSSFASYDIPITGIGYAGGWKKRVNHADGWGTLTTPYGTFQTIRMKSDIEQYDSIYLDTLGYGFPYYRNYTEYKWLGDGFGEPLCMFTENGPVTTVEYIDSVRNLIIGITDQADKNLPFSIYPNPVLDIINISFRNSSPFYYSFSLLDIRGRIIQISGQSYIPDLNYIRSCSLAGLKLKPGIYFVAIRMNDKDYFSRIIKK